MSLHERAMQYVAETDKGKLNYDERILSVERSFIPDVIGQHGGMHEVQVLKHKFSKTFLADYLDAIKFGLPKKRRYMSLWLVIPNYAEMFDTFDEINILAETKDGGFWQIYHSHQYKRFKRELEKRKVS